MSKNYINYNRLALEFDTDKKNFDCFYCKSGLILKDVCIDKFTYKGNCYQIHDFSIENIERYYLENCTVLSIKHINKTDKSVVLTIKFIVDSRGISVETFTENDNSFSSEFIFKGNACFGEDPENSTFAVSTKNNGKTVRVACGPGATYADNALFDRNTDTLLSFEKQKCIKFKYSFDEKFYKFILNTGNGSSSFHIGITENYMADLHNIRYKPINKKNVFSTPPVGWMTWYAVMFDASEKTVLENSEFLDKNLKKFGASCIWVDWEWYHSDLTGNEKEGIDMFHPNPERYPNGLKHVSEKIRELGLEPALWIGATNDTNLNDVLKEHPEWIILEKNYWCGKYWIDISHPGVVNEYIPMVFRQIIDWGYNVIKWDCLPATLLVADSNHDKLYNSQKSTEEAFRDIIGSARKTVGEDVFMLSCSGENYRSVICGIEFFDGARMGGDVFKWEDFKMYVLDRMGKYLPFNNTVLYTDPDVVVVREEFNNVEQARSRASYVSMLGLMYTIGDNLPVLGKDRVEIIKKTIPVLDCHPMDLCSNETKDDVKIIVQVMEKPFGSWIVADIFNTADRDTEIIIDLYKDLFVDDENASYLLYEFWEDKFLGEFSKKIKLSLVPYESKVIAVHKKKEVPQLVSTSRHVSQGALEIKNISWDESELCLKGKSDYISSELYTFSVYVPEGYLPCDKIGDTVIISFKNNLLKVKFIFAEDKIIDWNISFTKK